MHHPLKDVSLPHFVLSTLGLLLHLPLLWKMWPHPQKTLCAGRLPLLFYLHPRLYLSPKCKRMERMGLVQSLSPSSQALTTTSFNPCAQDRVFSVFKITGNHLTWDQGLSKQNSKCSGKVCLKMVPPKHFENLTKSSERPFLHCSSSADFDFPQGEGSGGGVGGDEKHRLEVEQLLSIHWHVCKLMSFPAHGFIFLAWRGYDTRRKFKQTSHRRNESAAHIQAGN